METIKHAIILAAGEGKRMRPVSLTTPKPLIKVNGTSFIDTIINALKANGIHEIAIVTGYKKEQFFETYRDDPDITVLENPYYLDGNNITSIYVARDFVPESFIIEGDQIISNTALFNPQIEKSGYCATYMENVPEWAIKVENNKIYLTTRVSAEDKGKVIGKDGCIIKAVRTILGAAAAKQDVKVTLKLED